MTMSNDVVFILGLLIGLLLGTITGAFIISALCVSKNSELQDRIDKAILEIECELERYNGSNEDIFYSGEWLELKTDTYIETLNNFIKILKGDSNE